MKNKLALLIGSVISGLIFGLIIYLFKVTESLKEVFFHALLFTVFVFLFELYIKPFMNKKFGKK